MKLRIVLLVVVPLVILTGCGANEPVEERNSTNAGETSSSQGGSSTVAQSESASSDAPDDQIVDAVEAMEVLMNSGDADGYLSYFCPEYRQRLISQNVLTDGWLDRQLEQMGTVDFAVQSVTLASDGSTYEVPVTRTYSKVPQDPTIAAPLPWKFSQQSGKWINCPGQ